MALPSGAGVLRLQRGVRRASAQHDKNVKARLWLNRASPQQIAIRHALVGLHIDLGFLMGLYVGDDEQRLRPVGQVEQAIKLH